MSAQVHEAGFEVVYHNDLSPCNFVFRQQIPVAIIDFDAAAFGRRVYDLGYAAWLWLQIGDEEISPREQVRRLALFANAYGELECSAIVEAMLVRQTIIIQQGRRAANNAMAEWAQAARIWTLRELAV
ncbi:aminoglycoside phosphotransferase (APT) family kinase protein [Rhizobium pisi]